MVDRWPRIGWSQNKRADVIAEITSGLKCCRRSMFAPDDFEATVRLRVWTRSCRRKSAANVDESVAYRMKAPRCGEHTCLVLQEHLDYREQAINELVQSGVVDIA